MKRAVAQRLEKDSGMEHLHLMPLAHADEWLGPESHVPNMGRELRRRNQRNWDIAGIAIGGALFAAGGALGSLKAGWVDPPGQKEKVGFLQLSRPLSNKVDIPSDFENQ